MLKTSELKQNNTLHADYRPRVLLVDDEAGIRSLLYTQLEREGYDVLAASSGEEALAIFQQSLRPIQLLVTDCEMPGMTGVELAAQCRLLNRNMGVLFISGGRPETDLQADIHQNYRDFLPKPFYCTELIKKARALLVYSAAQAATS
jgi:CheY-like chemotaxis protein